MTDAKARGDAGERMARQFYTRGGYRTLETNYRTRQGEVDLILQKGRLLVFAEVKTRTAGAMVPGAEAVTPGKRRRLVAAAQQYLASHQISDPSMRFDVVEVVFGAGSAVQIQCIENAFSG